MKYRLTWKDIGEAFFYRHGVLWFVVYISFILVVSFIYSSINLGFIINVWDYLTGLTVALPLILIMYLWLLLFIFLYSIPYWKKNIAGDHELYIEDNLFVWKSVSMQVRTDLSRLEYVKIQEKSFTIKFDGMKKTKIQKKWSLSGYEKFTEQLKWYFDSIKK